VFAPSPNANFDFDAAVYRAIDAERDDDLEHYEIEPVLPTLAASTSISTPTTALIPPKPSTATSPSPAAPSSHAPPKPGTNEAAYRKAKGKAREKLKAKQRRDAAPYGDFAIKPRLVNKHIKNHAKPVKATINASDMPHASTAYLGKRDSGGTGRVFQLEELVGEGSEYGFELRKWDG
jgi:hypothetical protein